VVDERYPIAETDSAAVSVLRHERREDGYPRWSTAIGLHAGATVSVPGHYPGVLAARLRDAERRFEPGLRLGRDEYLDLTALARDGEETLALSSTARSPVRVSIEVPRAEIGVLADALDRAQELIEQLRQGLGVVPDSLPDAL